MKSFASEEMCWNSTSGMSYSPHTIFARTCRVTRGEKKHTMGYTFQAKICGVCTWGLE